MPILGILASAQPGNIVNNSYESIATQTVSSSVASVTFSSIPSTYKHLQLRMSAITASWLVTEINGDTGANYKGHELRGNGSTVNAYTSGDVNDILLTIAGYTTAPTVGVVDILDYANTSKYKTLRTFGGGDQNGTGIIDLTSGLWMSTSAINSIKILGYGASNLLQYSHFALYGIKG